MTDAPKLHSTVLTCACCDFEPRPRATTTVPIGPVAVRPNLEVAAVRLRWVGENDARVSEAGDSDHTRVHPAHCICNRMQLHQRAVGGEQAEALLRADGHADEPGKANALAKTRCGSRRTSQHGARGEANRYS